MRRPRQRRPRGDAVTERTIQTGLATAGCVLVVGELVMQYSYGSGRRREHHVALTASDHAWFLEIVAGGRFADFDPAQVAAVWALAAELERRWREVEPPRRS